MTRTGTLRAFGGSLAIAGAALMVPAMGSAQVRTDVPLTASQNPTGAERPVSQAVWFGDTLYVSGWLDPDMKRHTDTKSQTVGIFEDMQKFLEAQHLTLADVVMVREFLQSDPGRDVGADIAGFRAGLRQYFGTTAQPTKPASTLTLVVLPSASNGALVEIDAIAVRPRKARPGHMSH